jgi:chromosomal replication initiation ATPase DnaA
MADVINTRVIIRRQDRIDYVMQGVCDYWKIRKDHLCAYVRTPKAVNRKKIVMKILYEVADLKLKEVADVMGYKPSGVHGVWDHIAKLNDDMTSPTRDGKLLKQEYEQVLKHLNL